jgi:hypothetical protein
MAEASQDKLNNMNSQAEYIAPEIEENELSDTDLENVVGGAGMFTTGGKFSKTSPSRPSSTTSKGLGGKF